MTMTCEYTRISLLFHILWKINTFTFEHICTFFPNVFSFNFSLHYCLVACIILYTNGQNYCPFFSQCKVTRNIITWAHCMYSQIRSLSCLIYRIISSTSNYVLVTTALIAAKFIKEQKSSVQRGGLEPPQCY
jgi:hypothetical protein